MANYHSNEWIMNRLQQHYDYLLNFYSGQVFGIFYKGSANYNMDTENSDVDSIAIILPTVGQLINREKISKEIAFENEIISCYDIKTFTELLLKSNEAILQTLFTKYKIVNYNFFWRMLTNKRETIATYNLTQFYRSLKGQMHTLNTKIWFLDDGRFVDYDAKIFAKLCKLEHLAHTLSQGYPYERVLDIDSDSTISKALAHSYDNDTVQSLVNFALEEINTIYKNAINEEKPINTEIISYVNNWCYQMECWYLKQTDWGLLYD